MVKRFDGLLVLRNVVEEPLWSPKPFFLRGSEDERESVAQDP